MTWRTEWKEQILITGAFLAFFNLLVGNVRFGNAVMAAISGMVFGVFFK